MPKIDLKKASTSRTVYVWIGDSASTTGAGKTGLVWNTANLVAYYTLPRAAAVAITLATQTVTGGYSSGGFVEVHATNSPGLYRLDLPDAAIASGDSVVVNLQGATGMVPLVLEIELTSYDPYDAVRAGLTALPNAAAEAAGGLYTRGTGAGQVNQSANGQIDVNIARWLNTAVTAATAAGRPDVQVVAMNNNTLTSGAIEAGAFSSGKYASYAISVDTFNPAVYLEIWAQLMSALTTGGSVGKLLADNLNATISSRASQTSVDAIDDFVDTEVAAILAAVDTEVGAIRTQTDKLNFTGTDVKATLDSETVALTSTDVTLSASERNAIGTAQLDLTAGVETGLTLRQALRLITAASAGKLSGATTTTIVIRNAVADSKDRITATVDSDGNRSAITVDLT